MSTHISPDLYSNEVLKKVFPNAHLAESTIWEGENIKSNTFDGEISHYNLFEQTSYEYKGRNQFLHFTKINKLFDIINSGNLWMSTLDSLEDKEELIYAGRYFNDDYQSELSSVIENIFSLSACESTEENIQSEYMWSHYGGNHTGCIIEYSFTNMNIYKMNFGIIRYGDTELKELDIISNLSNEFFKKYGFKVEKPSFFLRKILAFHKLEGFKVENEIRLLFEPNLILLNDRIESINCNENGYRRIYKLPFKEHNKLPENTNFDLETKLHYYPQIELKRIILGLKTTKQTQIELENSLKKSHFNSPIRIEKIKSNSLN